MDENKSIFPVGYYNFHKKQVYNFQLNRWLSVGLARYEDMKEIGKNVDSFEDWKNENIRMAKKAESEGRLLNAAIYYRSAEFYIIKEGEEKEKLYDKFSELFYKAVEGENFEKTKAPYKDTFLPVIKITAKGKCMGTIVLHGGYDSFMEEWFFMYQYLAAHGYDVIAFEGPGQGAALKKYDLPLDIEWEKPVVAILDHFNLNDVTLIGLSMGGWYCLRAAAFEKRIKRVIASGHAIDYLRTMPKWLYDIHILFINKFVNTTNKMIRKSIDKAKDINAWMMGNLMYITKEKEPINAFRIFVSLNIKNIHSKLVDQDVMYITGRDDHFVPFKMHKLQIKEFTNVKSLKDIVYTKETNAQNHCSIGNIKLSLNDMLKWIAEKS